MSTVYEPPTLVVHGTVEQLTLTGNHCIYIPRKDIGKQFGRSDHVWGSIPVATCSV
jgi:hypothetical protein